MSDIDTILGISAEQAEFARIIAALTAERNALRRALRNSQAKMLSSELKRVAEITALREALREVRITAAVHDNWQLAAPRIFAIVESVLKENCDE